MRILKSMFILVSLFYVCNVYSQINRPKLIIGIVVEQMKWDYLSRFSEKFSHHNGFNRLINNGFNCESVFINYFTTQYGPGLASIYTGSTPAIHGIINNNWYDKINHRTVYCLDDKNSTVTNDNSITTVSKISASNMLVTTIGDELRLATNFQSRVISIALNDRGAILPAGHTSNAAFFCGDDEKWKASDNYPINDREWIREFNKRSLRDSLLKNGWSTLLPIESYTESISDNNSYEKHFKNEISPVFPHVFNNENTPRLYSTPFGNTYTFEFAKQAINNEMLGLQNNPDMLLLSFSATDYIGHMFGPSSVEIEDCFLRFDKDLEDFLNFLDNKFGNENYLLFLTSSHGVAYNSTYLQDNNIPSGSNLLQDKIKDIDRKLNYQFRSKNVIESYVAPMIYLNDSVVHNQEIRKEVIKEIQKALEATPGVLKVVDLENINDEVLEENIKNKIKNGFFNKRSGDMVVIYEPAWTESPTLGAFHGSIYSYDTHIPLIWFGKNIPCLTDFSSINITDIAPTLAAMLKIERPNGCNGKVILSLLESMTIK